MFTRFAIIAAIAGMAMARDTRAQDLFASPDRGLTAAGGSPAPATQGPATPAPTTPTPAPPTLEGVAKSLEEVAKNVEVLGKHLTVTTADEHFKLVLGGAIISDFSYSTRRPIAPGTPFYLPPASPFGFDTRTFDADARQTMLFGQFSGPDVGGFKSGGLVLVNLYDNTVIQDRYGLLPINAYGELRNDEWRFAAGYQMDVFNPLNPTVLSFSYLGASGNTGFFRGQARVERFLNPDPDTHITLTGALSEPIPTTLDDRLRVSEDNGLPNLEARAAIALGPIQGEGPEAKRPIELGISGVAGQLRTTQLARRVVADVWGAGVDFRCALDPRWGVQGEGYVGQGLGTYGANGLTSVRPDTFQAIRGAGMWVEGYYYWCPDMLHTHIGFGIDDPVDGDVRTNLPLRNQTCYVTTVWDVTPAFRVAFQVSYLRTAYTVLRDNEGLIVQTQFQWKF